MAQMILGSRSTTVTTIVDGRMTWTLADLTAKLLRSLRADDGSSSGQP